jgi:aminobenzoyl-glutamate utilization protein B
MKHPITLVLVVLCFGTFAQKKKAKISGPAPIDNSQKTQIISNIEARAAEYAAISKQIWDYAELGYLEEKSSALLAETLEKEGFTIQRGVAGIPTAFTATYGSGQPVIGILGEYDALPGIAQAAVPEQKPIPGQRGGHACGHNLFGTASAAAAIEIKNQLKAQGIAGTVRFYGCPAEEGGSGKVYMVREGLFADVKAVLHWHPGSGNSADAGTSLANVNAKFRFRGVASHASGAPERGRSALDGVESMNYMVNMMREHIPSDTRIHYVITKGGEAPNVVPALAEVYYYVRNVRRDVVKDVWARMENAARGAALGTDTKVDWEILGGVFNILPNVSLAEVMHSNLKLVGGVSYTDAEKDFAQKIAETLGTQKRPIENASQVEDFKAITDSPTSGGSTDVGDVSWAVPTVGLRIATWVPGTAAHSWQSAAASGMSIGQKGLIVAAKTIACTALDLYKNPSLLEKAHAEWLTKRGGADFKYEALLGNRKPALDYRK